MIRHDADLGGPDPGTALRAAMSASVSDVRVPADLMDRAVSRNRKRKTRNGLMGAVVAVGALAAVIATAPGWASGHPASARQAVGPHVQRLQVKPAAYVLDHVATALMNSYRMISVDRGAGGLDHGSINYTDVATQQQRYVSGLRDSSGQPYLQTTTSIRHGIWTEFDVDYADHVYSTLTASNMDHRQRVTVSSWLPLQTSANPAVAFRQALKAHAITVVGHRVLDGRDTILLRVNDRYVNAEKLRRLARLAPRAHGLKPRTCSGPTTATSPPARLHLPHRHTRLLRTPRAGSGLTWPCSP